MKISPFEELNRDVLETKKSIRFSNPGTRLIFRRQFENQCSVPTSLPKSLTTFLKFYEKRLLNINLSDIPLEKPIFVVGIHRSGTTMLQDLICAHPDLGFINNSMASCPDCFVGAEHLRKKFDMNIEGERMLADSVEVKFDTPNEGVLFWNEWLEEDLHSLEYHPKHLGEFSSKRIQSIKDAIKKVLWCFEGKAKRFFSKNPRLVPHLSFLKDLFPDGKFIHIVRDGRICANSLVKFYRLEQSQLAYIRSRGGHNLFPDGPIISFPRLPNLAQYIQTFGPDNLETTSRLWNDALDWVRNIKDSIPNFYEVRYEDILANPRGEMEKIFSFCELSPAAADNSNYWDKLNKVGAVHHTNRYGHFDLVEGICKENLQRYGYL